MFKALAFLAAACMVAAGALSAFAQNVPMNTQRTAQNTHAINRADKLFMMSLAPSNEADLQISQLAAQKSKNPEVKQLAAKIVQGDQAIQQRVSNMAAKNAISLPGALDTPDVHLKTAIKTELRDPKMFDQAYVQAMLIKFLDTVTMFRLEAAQTNNQAILMFTQSNLPKLEKTLDKIETVSQKLQTTTTAMK
jgi:predicted outer membrane protein